MLLVGIAHSVPTLQMISLYNRMDTHVKHVQVHHTCEVCVRTSMCGSLDIQNVMTFKLQLYDSCEWFMEYTRVAQFR